MGLGQRRAQDPESSGPALARPPLAVELGQTT